MKIHKIHNEVFDYQVFWLEGTPSEAEEWVDKKRIDRDDICFHDIQGISLHDKLDVIYIKDFSDFVILHECIHCIQHILEKQIWVNTSYSNTEVLAYNVDWLYRKILYKYHKGKWNEKYKTYK